MVGIGIGIPGSGTLAALPTRAAYRRRVENSRVLETGPCAATRFDLDKKIDKVTIECDDLPDDDHLRLEITKIEGPVERYQTQPDGPVEAKKQLALAFQRMDRDQNAQPIAGMHVSFTTSRKELTIMRRIVQPPRRMFQPGLQLAKMRQKGEEELNKILAQMKKEQTHAAKEKYRPQLDQIEQGLGHLDLIEKIDGQAKIHYRILLQSGSHQVPLYDSQLAGPAPEPAGPQE